jgi:hypothetical protein
MQPTQQRTTFERPCFFEDAEAIEPEFKRRMIFNAAI